MTRTPSPTSSTVLGSYRNRRGRRRELVAQSGAAGSLLVIDREALTGGDRRLVAHLGADEPSSNAALVCRLYLEDEHGRSCRRVVTRDLTAKPFSPAECAGEQVPHPAHAHELTDGDGFRYRMELLPSDMSIPQLRWCRRGAHSHPDGAEPLSVRDVIGRLQSYEPARAMTERAVALHRLDPCVSVATLAAELARVHSSRIVLNRGLRETTLAAMSKEGLSMSEIAMRCGRSKRDARGALSGETSWLARRLGLLPEGGERLPTPWVHSDVLALIAREGLGVSPREVELA